MPGPENAPENAPETGPGTAPETAPEAARMPPQDWDRWRRQVDLTDYDERWRRMAEAGVDPHGEAALVCLFEPTTVLDAGCGTGRVAIELARRGLDVVGTDLDQDMIAAARAKAPDLTWVHTDLAELRLDTGFDVVVLAGNVVPYIAATTRPAAIAACARHLNHGGRLVAGFQLRAGWPTLTDYDSWCADAGLTLENRWATWDRERYTGGDYAVSVHLGT